ncbi:hypothetical protein HMPREF3196_00777 [Bifidobacterium bifidum]|uniref:Uncharacterized protein n=1 Tax=Bifidobacterium bifidum TaxID=1681 RepID=A0A133KQG4_BIFBI|nr:hypothetical protein HMPREF3196_00777 [Bifidobacterium bifidum]
MGPAGWDARPSGDGGASGMPGTSVMWGMATWRRMAGSMRHQAM